MFDQKPWNKCSSKIMSIIFFSLKTQDSFVWSLHVCVQNLAYPVPDTYAMTIEGKRGAWGSYTGASRDLTYSYVFVSSDLDPEKMKCRRKHCHRIWVIAYTPWSFNKHLLVQHNIDELVVQYKSSKKLDLNSFGTVSFNSIKIVWLGSTTHHKYVPQSK